MSYFRSTAGRVVSCILYLLAGVATGGPMLLYMGLQSSRGSGAFITGDISFVGSVLLVVAAVAAVFGFRGTGYIALTGVFAVWVFYLSMFVSSVSAMAKAGKNAAEVVPLILVGLLMIVSVAYPVASIVGLRRTAT